VPAIRKLEQFRTKIIEPRGLSQQKYMARLNLARLGTHPGNLVMLRDEGNRMGHALGPVETQVLN
jgi:hypothetical protein